MIELQSGAPAVALPAPYSTECRHRRPRPPWWIWPNIFSLEAPAVAVLWHLLIARAFALQEGFAIPMALGFSVWVIYLVDHILDTRGVSAAQVEPARKVFFRNHWHLMLGIAAGALILTVLFARIFLARSLFYAGIGAGFAVCLYFCSLHFLPTGVRVFWPREGMVALLFAIGICLPFWLNAVLPFHQVLFYALPVFLLCWLNCCAVEAWDWQAAGSRLQHRPGLLANRVAEHMTLIVCLVIAVSIGAGVLEDLYRPFLGALLLSCLSMADVARLRTKSGANRQRLPLYCVLLDLALCWPLPLLAALRLSSMTFFMH